MKPTGFIERADRLDGLTGLRAIAALWVISYHFRTDPFSAFGLEKSVPLLGYGYLGVDLFFMLSGFVIYHVHGNDFDMPTARGVMRFIGLRLARIYPVHIATLAVLVGMLLAGRIFGAVPTHPEDFSAAALGLQLTLLQAWGLGSALSWNFPAWSISAEWFVYLMFPVMAPSLRQFGVRGLVLAMTILLVALAVVYLWPFHADMNQYSGMALPRAGIEFAIGCLLRRLTIIRPLHGAPLGAACVATLAIALAGSLMPGPIHGIAPVLAFPMLILAASHSGNWVARFSSLPSLVWLGELSYALYMCHAIVLKAAGRVVESRLATAGPVEACLVSLGFLLLLAAATLALHYGIEQPARRYFRARLSAVNAPPHGAVVR